MENASQKLLESATYKTLHAVGFSRSTTQTTTVLTDLLSRYLTLLTSTAAKYANHAERTRLTPQDAISALEELGVDLEELTDFGKAEGLELNRYAISSIRRIEDLHEFRAQLNDGLKQDYDDVIPLVYAPYDSDDEAEEDSEDENEDVEMAEPASVKPPEHTPMDVDVPMRGPRPIEPLPILPLSPVSNPASPTYRKRHRPVDWDPPDHVPEFLPPFPTMEDAPPSPQAEVMPEPIQQQQQAAPAEALTSLAGADWLMPVPYNQSSLASQPEFHLPAHLPLPEPREPKLPTPKADQALIGAYHHVLTHRQSTNTTANGNPLRHKVAMALLSLAQNTPRWDVPDTLFSNMTSNQARVTAMGPAHPIALGDSHGAQVMKNNKDFKFPTVTQRTVVAPDKLTSVVSQPSSRLPDLSKLVLPPKIYARATRLAHPPVLIADNKPLTYGQSIPAPWNLGPIEKDKKDDPPRVLPDARLFATWESESKNYWEPLKGNRPRAKTLTLTTSSSRKPGWGGTN